MKVKYAVCAILISFILAGTLYGRALFESGVIDQKAVSVTVYNNNLGLIKEIRNIELTSGQGELRFMDVPSHIMPETVRVVSLNHSKSFSILEQNYEYDLMDAGKLLDKYVGKEIKIVDFNKFKDRKEVVAATLLSNHKGQTYRIGEEIYLGHPGYKVLPELPENLVAKPTLAWLYENRENNAHQLEVTYLTRNISWRADYVMVLNKNDTTGDLSGWVTLDNKSGAAYRDATLKLVAGEVNRVQEMRSQRVYAMEAMKSAAAPQFEEKGFFEYHIYNLQRNTTIKDKQIKQVRLLEADRAGVKKELRVAGKRHYYNRKYHADRSKQPVNVYISFENSEKNRLGMPLPAGIMRLYKEDKDKSIQFIGEDRISHTPKDEEVLLKVGESFDVTANRVQTDYRKITSTLHESEWELILKNHKDHDVSVALIEPLQGNWRIISHSHPYTKTNAFTIRFDVAVPKDGKVKVKYRVKTGI